MLIIFSRKSFISDFGFFSDSYGFFCLTEIDKTELHYSGYEDTMENSGNEKTNLISKKGRHYDSNLEIAEGLKQEFWHQNLNHLTIYQTAPGPNLDE